MKLSEFIILKKLKNNYPVKLSRGVSSELLLDGPLFYFSKDIFENNKVYVAREEEIQNLTDEQTADSLLFVIGESCVSLKKCHNIQYLPKDTDVASFMNILYKIFDFYRQWERKLEEISRTTRDLQEMLDVSYSVFHNPLLIHSSDYFIVSYSSIMDERQELEGILDNNTLFEYSRDFKNEMKTYAGMGEEKTFYIPKYFTGVKAMCCNIYDRERYVYRISILEQQRRFCDSDMPLFTVLCRNLKVAILQSGLIGEKMGYQLDRLISNVLNGGLLKEESFAEFGWHVEHKYFCIQVKLAAMDVEQLTVKFICGHIENLVQNSVAFFHKNHIVVFVNLSRSGLRLEEVLEKIIYFFRDSYLKAGISREFTGLSRLAEYDRQAGYALEIGDKILPHLWTYRFDDIVLEYMLEMITKPLPIDMVVSSKLLKLKEHDRAHNTDYYETVKIYVKNHLNAVQTAKQLYIHRSTFLYRMEKIDELIHIDLTNENTLLYIMLSLELMDML